jgi:hypothetical protein
MSRRTGRQLDIQVQGFETQTRSTGQTCPRIKVQRSQSDQKAKQRQVRHGPSFATDTENKESRDLCHRKLGLCHWPKYHIYTLFVRIYKARVNFEIYYLTINSMIVYTIFHISLVIELMIETMQNTYRSYKLGHRS